MEGTTPVDLTKKIGRTEDLPDLTFTIADHTILISSGKTVVNPEAESLMVAESLSVLGNEIAFGLATRGHNDLVNAWREVRKLDVIPPGLPSNYSIDYEVSAHDREIDAIYYADKLGMPVEYYKLAALFDAIYPLIWDHETYTGPEIHPLDGLLAYQMGLLPSKTDLL
jgi:hypothetical protein